MKIEEEKSNVPIIYDKADKFLEKQNPVQLFQVELGGKEDLYINKVGNLQWKMKRRVRNIIDGMNYDQLVHDLDGFTGTVRVFRFCKYSKAVKYFRKKCHVHCLTRF